MLDHSTECIVLIDQSHTWYERYCSLHSMHHGWNLKIFFVNFRNTSRTTDQYKNLCTCLVTWCKKYGNYKECSLKWWEIWAVPAFWKLANALACYSSYKIVFRPCIWSEILKIMDKSYGVTLFNTDIWNNSKLIDEILLLCKIDNHYPLNLQVKVAMKFVTDSSLQLRRPAGYEEASTRNVIELYFNTRMDNALLYFAGGPLPDVSRSSFVFIYFYCMVDNFCNWSWINPNLSDPFWGCTVSIWSQSHLWRLEYLSIKADHISLQRGMSKLYLETNRNTDIQIICKLCSSGWCQKVNVSSLQKEQNAQGRVN